ncbi:MAG TPA: VOC family protein [Candidatus Acidoferrum sp.]|jgi:catechol-2,3-dioxygenase|nr:VOC family protein [Candidatus Acidoferrum sp.]
MEHLIAKLLHDFEDGRMTRRQLIQSLALAATAASAASAAPGNGVLKATYLNHVGYQVADYGKSRDWYAELFGMKVMLDDGKKANLGLGESLLIFHPRKIPTTPVVDHVCLTIANWDTDKNVRGEVEEELKRRGFKTRTTANSFHFSDPDGFEVQVGGKDQ